MRIALLILLLSTALPAQDLDGSKIFTTDTSTQPPGTFSLNLQYLTSTATSEFVSGGGRSLLGGGPPVAAL